MDSFTCARWRAPMEEQSVEDAPTYVFQSGRVYCDGERVGLYEQSETQFVAGLDEHTTLIVPLGQAGPVRYSATFVLGDEGDEMHLPGSLVREALLQ